MDKQAELMLHGLHMAFQQDKRRSTLMKQSTNVTNIQANVTNIQAHAPASMRHLHSLTFNPYSATGNICCIPGVDSVAPDQSAHWHSLVLELHCLLICNN